MGDSRNKNKSLKIGFFNIKDWEKKHILKSLKKHNCFFDSGRLDSSNAKRYSDLEVISVFIDSKLTSKVLKNFKKLRLISTRSTGFDHIDLDYCKRKNILVSNVPSYGENTVAEHAVALLLTITRRISESVERVRQGQFSPEGLTGMDLKDKVVGVVGTGHIGINFIKMVRGFDMKVIASDIRPNKSLAVKLGFVYVSMDYLLSKSDVISLHVPYNKKTYHIIDRKAIQKMKKGVIVINTARGGLIETDALFDGLKEGKVKGAGLDVLEEEGFLKEEIELLHRDTYKNVDFKTALENHVMVQLHNVVVTPHNAFNSTEALERILKTTVENILCYAGGSYCNLVQL